MIIIQLYFSGAQLSKESTEMTKLRSGLRVTRGQMGSLKLLYFIIYGFNVSNMLY